jgi:hypothetical protein
MNSTRLFFESVEKTFQDAIHSIPAKIKTIGVDKYAIEIKFAGEAMQDRIMPAIDHLMVSDVLKPDLRLRVFDSASTKTRMPGPPWSTGDYIARGEVQGFSREPYFAAFQLGSDVLSLLDTEKNIGYLWTRDAGKLPYYESGAPLRTVFFWWFRKQSIHFLHAAAIGTPEGGVLIAGKRGSGKSTSALACLNSDLLYAGDDYVMIAQDPIPYVYSVYNSGKIDAFQLKNLPFLKDTISNSYRLDTEKALVFLKSKFPDRITRGFPVVALLVPQITGQLESRIVPSSPARAFSALAPSTIFQLAGAGHQSLDFISHFVSKVPAYKLEAGTRLEEIPRLIKSLLNGVHLE